jgi:Na+(H+)/acetate symporter ActP
VSPTSAELPRAARTARPCYDALFGGMLATTWVQVVKAALLLTGGALLAILVLLRFGFNPLKLSAVAAEKYGTRVLQPGAGVVSARFHSASGCKPAERCKSPYDQAPFVSTLITFSTKSAAASKRSSFVLSSSLW